MKHSNLFGGVFALALIIFLSACGDDPTRSPGKDGRFKVVPPLQEGLLEHVIAQGVPRSAAQLGFRSYEKNRHHIKNASHFAIVDFTQHSSQRRMFVIDRFSGTVYENVVAHGVGSDPDKNGLPEHFSNVPNSRKSSLGAYLISEKYYGKYGGSLKTDGLEASNNMVRRRTIVLHQSMYVKDGKPKQGMSWGCFAVPQAVIGSMISKLRDGAFLYAYGKRSNSVGADNRQIERILIDPAYQWVNEEEAAPIEGEW